jgi:hypothetical protein
MKLVVALCPKELDASLSEPRFKVTDVVPEAVLDDVVSPVLDVAAEGFGAVEKRLFNLQPGKLERPRQNTQTLNFKKQSFFCIEMDCRVLFFIVFIRAIPFLKPTKPTNRLSYL